MTAPRRLIAPVRAVLMLTLAAACSGDDASGPTDAGPWNEYSGAWFSIEYPAAFEVMPSLPSETADGYDSVVFEAPDGSVSFYVLAPQWGRIAEDLVVDPATETEVSTTERTVGDRTQSVRTIRANDGSYTREIEVNREQDGLVQWVFQFRYASEAARERYAPAFARFQSTLRTFTD